MMTVSRSGGRGPYYQLPMEETVRCSPLCRKMFSVAHFGGKCSLLPTLEENVLFCPLWRKLSVEAHYGGNC
jgi:hypothetical protein